MTAKQHGFILSNTLILIALIMLMLLPLITHFVWQQKLFNHIAQHDQNELARAKAIRSFKNSILNPQQLSADCITTWNGSDQNWQQLLQQRVQQNRCWIVKNGIRIYFIAIMSPHHWWLETA